MNFIEKISQSRIKWSGQSSFSIDEAFQKLDSNNEYYSAIKKEILNSQFVYVENNRITIDRIYLQRYWNSNVTMGSKILLTLFWGGLHKTQNFKSDFVREFDKNMKLIHEFDDNFFKKKIEVLFVDFESKKKIAGVGYAFFSKFFQFAIPDSPYIICDQWTMKAVASYLISNEQHEELNRIFSLSINSRNQINIGLRSKKGSVSQSYLSFIEVFKKLTNELSQVMPQLKNEVRKTEEILFGWDRRIKSNDYDNPRFYYQTVLLAYLKINDPNNEISDKVNKSIIPDIEKVFIYKTASYYALRISPENKFKIGYFDKNAWLCMRDEYAKLLKGISWKEGNSKGGSESKKIQFKSITELIKQLESNGLFCDKVNW